MPEKMNLTLITTRHIDMPTIQVEVDNKKYFLYSKYNPIIDSKAFAEETYDRNIENYLIYGLGLGYHINELENLIKVNNKNYHIYIIECNKSILNLAMNNVNLSGILNNPNITLFVMENERKFYDKLNKILSIKNIKIAIHRPSLNIIPKEFIELKYLFEEFMMKQDTIATYQSILDENFKVNIKNFDSNVDTLFNKLKNKPLYLVAAGPSLDKNIHELAKVQDNGIILSVGRAVRPLLSANIIPDYIIITDPSDFLYDMQLKGLDIDVPIIVLSTCDKNVMLKYKGLKYIALQEGYLAAEEYAKDNNHLLVKTGGSVATTGLDIAIRMGCNPIIFVGQDLAFTDNKTHSKDTFSKDIIESKRLRNVEDINGNSIQTSKNLYIYLRWIQNRIAKENDIEFIDATEGGARIMGTKVIKLRDIVCKVNK
ncbi:DUF115 domain-containing protein [Tissierella sp. MSJ-40]|uniref:DUF115 domain-containing protein n=1 Tax=Tissierella simiarum TaxID=2841534 RepID=A0ABS6E1D7_9FIRM|nr:6-hydroxymethylpterin diphosphokinase MptE-like protein [Tissierella simiarum]MBU5436661.1 DUF115 domain-containing protein [Tissierella simiarum]